jgi:hypothetical protein
LTERGQAGSGQGTDKGKGSKDSVEDWALVAHACNPSYSRRQKSGGSQFEVSPGQIVHETLSTKKKKKKEKKKNPSQKKAGRMAQAVRAPA